VNDERVADSHLLSNGAKRLLVTAPSSLAGVQSVIYGVNHGDYNGGRIVDNASCTTKAAASPLKFLDDQFGVRSVHLRTVHAALPGMNPVDTHRSPGKATDDTLLKGRGLLGNMVPGSTGAAKGLVRVFPDLEGRMDAQALNVPLMNGSLITLNVRLARDIPGSTPAERVQYLQHAFRQYIDGVLPPDLLGYKVMDMEQSGDPLTLLDVAQMKHPPDAMINRRSIVSLFPDEVGLDAWYNNELSSVHGTARMIPFLANYDRNLAARKSAVRSV
jgi:glyceraldehyde-3-phosphate dehydrogenase type I